MSVYKLSHPTFELEGRALAKVTHLSATLLEIACRAEEISMWCASGEAATMHGVLEKVALIDTLLASIEDAALSLARGLRAGDLAVFEMYCDLTDMRAMAFAKVRADRLFVNDIELMDGDTPLLVFAAA